MKRFLKFTVSVFIVFVILLISACSMQEKLIFFPEKLKPDYEFKFQGNYREYSIPASDSIQLSTVLFKADSSKGCILYFHGNAGSLRTWGSIAEDFTKLNYDILLVDYRGYGKSEGTITSEKQLHQDAKAVYDWLLKKYTPEEIIVYGRSIGTCIAAKVAAENPVQKLILETSYYSFTRVAKKHYPFLPLSLILHYKLETFRYLKKVACPVYLFHGTNDEIIPYQNSPELILENKAIVLFTIQGGHHNDLNSFAEYHSGLKKALE